MHTLKVVYILPFLALIGTGLAGPRTAEASDVKLYVHLGYGYVPWPSYYSVYYYYPHPYYRGYVHPKHYPHYYRYPRMHYYPRPHDDGHDRFRDHDRSRHHGHGAPHHRKRDSFASVIRPERGKGSPGDHRRR